MGDSSLQSVLSDDDFEILDTSPSMELMSLRNGNPCLKTDTVDRNNAAQRSPTVKNVVVNEDATRLSLSASMEDPVFRSFKAPALNNFIREPELADTHFTSMSSMRSSVYQGEIPERLSALLQENKELKDTLQKNNVAMREQFSMLMTWQEQVRNMHQDQKQKLVETKDLMTRLKLENAELKKSTMTSSVESDLRDENDILRKQLETVVKEALQKSSKTSYDNSITEDNVLLTQQLQAANKTCKEMSLENQHLKEQVCKESAHVDSLNKKISELETDLEKVKEENQVLNESKQELENKLAALKIDYENVTLEFHQTKILVDDLRAEEDLRRKELRAIQSQLAQLQSEKNCFEIINNPPESASSVKKSENIEIKKKLREIRRLEDLLSKSGEEFKIIKRDWRITKQNYETAQDNICHLKDDLETTKKNYETAVKKIDMLESILARIRRDFKIVQDNLDTVQLANLTNEGEVARHTEIVSGLKEKICSLENQFESIQNDLKISQDSLKTVQNEKENLQDQLKVAQANKVNLCLKSFEPSEEFSLGETTTSIITKVNLYEKYLNNIIDVYNQQQERQSCLMHSLEGALDITEPTHANHKVLSDFKSIALRYKTELMPEREKLVDAQNQFGTIFQQFKILANELQEIKKGSESSTIATKNMLSEQERKFSEQIDSLHAQLLAKEEAIAQKEQDRVRVMEELVVVKQQNEAIDILKAQLELYKSDFEQERSQRQNIAVEREQISEDLRLLQRRNEQLIKEVQEARSAEGSTGPHPAAPVERPSTAPRRLFKCPKCDFGFYTLNAVENHIERCLDENNVF